MSGMANYLGHLEKEKLLVNRLLNLLAEYYLVYIDIKSFQFKHVSSFQRYSISNWMSFVNL